MYSGSCCTILETTEEILFGSWRLKSKSNLVAQKPWQFINIRVNRFDWLKWFSFNVLGWKVYMRSARAELVEILCCSLNLLCLQAPTSSFWKLFTLFSILNDSDKLLMSRLFGEAVSSHLTGIAWVLICSGWCIKHIQFYSLLILAIKKKKKTIKVRFLELTLVLLTQFFLNSGFLKKVFLTFLSVLLLLFSELLFEVLKQQHNAGPW